MIEYIIMRSSPHHYWYKPIICYDTKKMAEEYIKTVEDDGLYKIVEVKEF